MKGRVRKPVADGAHDKSYVLLNVNRGVSKRSGTKHSTE